MLDGIADLVAGLRVEVNPLPETAAERTVRLWVDAESISASVGPDRWLLEDGPWTLEGAPIFDGTFATVQEGLDYLCDPDGARDENGDGVMDDDCDVGPFLALVEMPCPIVAGAEMGATCRPFAAVDERMAELRENVRRLVITLDQAEARWVASPVPGDPRPVLDIRYHLAIDFAVDDTYEYFVDVNLTEVEGHLLLPFHAGDAHCFGWACCPNGRCD
jgi:hypothetical protein